MKILIFNFRKLTNTGGPEGYLYNIHEELRRNPSETIDFYSDFISPAENTKKKTEGEKSWIKTVIYDIWQIYKLCWKNYRHKLDNLPEGFNINNYDYVHVHKIVDYYTFRNTFPKYKGKVFITTHCPCPWTDEMLSHYDRFVSFFRKFILHWECKVYKEIDYLMFPCEGAREPYEKEPKIREVFRNNEHKFFYVPSAITDIIVDENKIQKFSELGIPDNAFVISYFGRHNTIKGYDIIRSVGEKLLNKYPNLYFVCAGRGDIIPLKHPRWIELGFINNTHELLHQSDLYISANRETYFDLVVLEILRSSTKLILSKTGGNMFFYNLPKSERIGIDFFSIDDLNELLLSIENEIELKKGNLVHFKEGMQSNRQLFLKRFTMPIFMENYISSVSSL